MVISSATPSSLATGGDDTFPLDVFVADLSAVQVRETTALLSLLAELVTDDDLAAGCRCEVGSRNHMLPAWISGLPRVHVHAAMRFVDVLGEFDVVVFMARLVGGKEFACLVSINHNELSRVTDMGFFEGSLDSFRDRVANGDGPLDASLVDMTLADARAWVEQALKNSPSLSGGKAWPGCRPLVQWLINRMPEGGTGYRPPEWKSAAIDDLLREFFASPQGAPFADAEYRVILGELLDTGCGDPLRWSAPRVSEVLAWPDLDDYVCVECRLDVPDILRAFIPFVHAKSGIREGLTAEALTVIDEMRLPYKRDVLRGAGYYDADDQGA